MNSPAFDWKGVPLKAHTSGRRPRCLAAPSLVPAPLYDTLPAQRRELQTRAP